MKRDTIIRAVSDGVSLEDEERAPRLVGHFALTDEWAEINSLSEGHFMERFAPGVFSKTISENRRNMRVLFQHGRDPAVGDKPLGGIEELREDGHGAYYEVGLLDAPYVRDNILPGLRAGLYGASFRFKVIRDEIMDRPPRSAHNPNGLQERVIREAAVREFGPVTFPAYEGATAKVRSLTDRFTQPGPEDLQRELRERKQLLDRIGRRCPEASLARYVRRHGPTPVSRPSWRLSPRWALSGSAPSTTYRRKYGPQPR